MELTDNLIMKQATLDRVTSEKTALLYKIELLQVKQNVSVRSIGTGIF